MKPRKPLKNKLILPTNQDFDPLSCIRKALKIKDHYKNNRFKKVVTTFGVILLIFVLPFLVKNNPLSQITANSASANVSGVFNNNSENSAKTEEKSVNTEIYFNSSNIPVLQAAVNIDPSPAKGGGDINILDNMVLSAETGVFGTTLDMDKINNKGRISLYEVREGDTLSQIGEMFGVSVNTINWANDIRGQIRPGQSLVILPVNGLTHVVKSGGTIADVAKIYDADVNEVALFNGLDVNVALKPGDEIIVPNVDPKVIEQKNTISSTQNTRIAAASTSPNRATSSSYYINPVPGGIITQGVHGYNAVDIAAAFGTPVRATASGRVITSKESGWNGGYGNYVVISHDNGTQSLYSHNSRNTVYVGQYVEQGQVVGYMGSTGRSTGNHLHFEVRGGTNPLIACRVGSVCR